VASKLDSHANDTLFAVTVPIAKPGLGADGVRAHTVRLDSLQSLNLPYRHKILSIRRKRQTKVFVTVS